MSDVSSEDAVAAELTCSKQQQQQRAVCNEGVRNKSTEEYRSRRRRFFTKTHPLYIFSSFVCIYVFALRA